jgi:hypothetical protein
MEAENMMLIWATTEEQDNTDDAENKQGDQLD